MKTRHTSGKRPSVINHFILLLALWSVGCVHLSPSVNSYREHKDIYGEHKVRITSFLSDELSPAMDSTGKYLYFVSTRNGNRDIWRWNVAKQSAEPITLHSADDFDPAPAPNSNGLAFASSRFDAKGDILLMDSVNGNIRRLTDRKGSERQPVWMPDGSAIAFTCSKGSSVETICLLDLKSNQTSEIVHRPGFDPSFDDSGQLLVFTSDTQLSGGKGSSAGVPCLWLHRMSDGAESTIHECTRPEGFARFFRYKSNRWIVFSRFEDDTNADGHIDWKDRPSLWMQQIHGWKGKTPSVQRAIPLTDGSTSDITPWGYNDRLYYASRTKDDLNIWRFDLDSAFAAPRDWVHVQKQLNRSPDGLWALFVLRRCEALLLPSPLGKQCALKKADRLLEEKLYAQAEAAYRSLLNSWNDAEIANLATIGMVSAQMNQRLALGMSPSEQVESTPLATRLLKRLSGCHEEYGELGLLKGDILRRVGRWTESLNILEQTIAHADEAHAARALLLMGDVVRELGDFESSKIAWLDVLRRYPGQHPMVEDAARRIIESAKSGLNGSSGSIARIEDICARWDDLPLLSAMARLEIGKLYLAQGNKKLAKRAFEQVRTHYGKFDYVAPAAVLALASMAEDENDLAKALDYATELVENYSSNSDYVNEGEAIIARLASIHARELIRQNEPEMAIKVYEKLLLQNPHDLSTERRIISLLASSGHTMLALRRYANMLKAHPDDPVALYLYGLVLTYIDPPSRFEQAMDYLDRALAIDGQLAYAHQTRGWILEQRYHLLADETGLQAAADEYQAALGLLDTNANAADEADLLVNLGNVFFSLGNYRSAYEFYKKRFDSPERFILPTRRLIFLERFARSALLSEKLQDAVAGFSFGSGLARDLGRTRMEFRLRQGQAAALRLMGNYSAAANILQAVCESIRNSKDLQLLARCIRNKGYNLYMLGDMSGAAGAFGEAIEITKMLKEKQPGNKVVSVGLSANSSRAALGFDTDGELDLLYSFSAKLFRRSGDLFRSDVSLSKRISVLKTYLTRGGASQVDGELSIAMNNRGVVLLHQGREAEAAKSFSKAGRLAVHTKYAKGIVANLSNQLDMSQAGARVDSAVLLKDTKEALDVIDDKSTPLLDRVRLLNTSGVIKASLLQRRPEHHNKHPVVMEARIVSSMDDLDSRILALHSAQADFEAAADLAGMDGSRRGLRFSLMAELNRAEVMRRAGMIAASAKIQKQVFEKASSYSMLGLLWRVPWQDDAQRAALLMSMPPSVSGCADDESVRFARDDLFGHLIVSSLGRQDLKGVFHWVERYLLQKRRDSVWRDLTPLSAQDRHYLHRIRSAEKSLRLALESVSPDLKGKDLVERGKTVLAALGSWKEAVGQGDGARDILRSVMQAEQKNVDEIRSVLGPRTGLLAAVALQKELVVLLLTSRGLYGHREPVGRAEVMGQVDDLWNRNLLIAAKARRLLSRWILGGFQEQLKSLKRLVAVTDDLRTHRHSFPLAVLLYKGQLLGSQIPLSHVYCSSDLERFIKLRNIRMLPAAWVGTRPGKGLMKLLDDRIGSLKMVDGTPGQIMKEISKTGLVVWDVPLLVDDEKPMRSGFESDPMVGAPNGVFLKRLLSVPSASGLWLVRAQPGGVGGRFGGMALDLAAQGSLVPSTGIIPGIPGEKNDKVLPWIMDSLQKRNPAEAFAEVLGKLGDNGVGWQKLLGMELRGYWGMDLSEKRRFATTSMGKFAAKAMADFRKQRWSDALALFLDVRRMAVFLGKKSILGKVDVGIVTSAFRLKKYDLAAKHEKWILAAAIESSDTRSEAKALHFLGILRSKAGHCTEAINLLSQAMERLDACGMEAQAAQANADLAKAKNAAFDYSGAIEAAENALDRFHKLKNTPGEIRMMRFIGTVYLRRMNMVSDARFWFRKALGRASEGNLSSLQASILLDLARTELSTGSFDISKAKANKALEMFEALSDEGGQAESLLELANAMWYRGEYQGAFRAQNKALEWAERAGKTRLIIMAKSLGGLILLNLGEVEKASSALRHALHDAMAAGLKDEQAVQLNNLGIVLRAQGKLTKALEKFEQALLLDSAMKNKRGRAYDLRNMGVVEQMLGKNTKAKKHMLQALQLSKVVNDKFNQAKTLVALAKLDSLVENRREAAEYANSAYGIAQQLGAREVQWRALMYMGKISQQAGSFEDARGYYARAISLVEQMRASLKTEAFRSGFLDNKYQLYEDMIHLLVGMGRISEAFEYSERSRARVFLDMVSRSHLELGNDNERHLIFEYKKLRRKMEELRHTSSSENAYGVDVHKEITRVTKQYDDISSRLKAVRPDLLDYLEVRSVTSDELVRQLNDGVVLVSYYVTSQDTLAFVVSTKGITVVTMDITKDSLSKKITYVRKLLQGFEEADSELRALFSLLVAPVVHSTKNARIVGIIPHGPLHYLPFGALKLGKNHYWSDDVLLFSVPSASVMVRLLKRKQFHAGPYDGTLVVGDPRHDLAFARMEAGTIAEEQGHSRIIVGEDATEGMVKKLMVNSGMIHFAAHGKFDTRDPMHSAVILAPGVGGDGNLTAAEILKMNLAARLVSLSGCDTGLSQIGNGDELVGLQRAFLAAGAGSVMSSLWRVDDVATAMLMKQFYRNLRSYDEPTALRLAQEVVRKYFPQPGYWASFVLTGAW